jgi:hypothetical protein
LAATTENAAGGDRPRMIFNVGSRRSGTFWLQRIVTAHPDVAAVPSETHLFSHGIAPLWQRFHHGTVSSPQVGAMYIPRDVLIERTRALCDAAFATFAEGHPYLAERTPLHVHNLELIAELYPEARFVHIIRDGRDVARSLLNQDWGPATIAEAAEEWRRAVLAGRAAGLEEGNYRELRYERLLASPREEVTALYGWLGLELSDRTLEAALAEADRRANVGPSARGGVGVGKWREEWGAEQLTEFERVAGELLAQLGYEAAEPSGDATPAAGSSGAAAIPPRPTPTFSSDHQVIVDDVVAALAAGDVERIGALAGDELVVRVGSREAAEAAGLALLTEAIASDRWLGGPARADRTFPGLPWTGVLLSYGDGEEGTERQLQLRFFRGRLAELSVHGVRDW